MDQSVSQPFVMSSNEQFSVVIDLHDFSDDEICVKVLGQRVLVVEARHNERTIPGYGPVSRHFLHRYRLPPGINPDSVNCHLSQDQKLIVVAAAENYDEASTVVHRPVQERQMEIKKHIAFS